MTEGMSESGLMGNSMVEENSRHLEERVMKVIGITGNTMVMGLTFLVRENGKETSMKEKIRMEKEKDKEHTLSPMGKSI